MVLTDKPCFGFSIAALVIYVTIFGIANIIGYGPINQPMSDGKQCELIYFPDLKDISKTLCLDECPKTGDTKLQCDNCSGNILNTDEYNNACLPTLYNQLTQVMPALKTPKLNNFTQSLISNCEFLITGLFFLLSILYIGQRMVRQYLSLMISFLTNFYPYGLLWLSIVMAYRLSNFHDMDKLERTGESRQLNYQSIGILVEAFNLKSTYTIMLLILIKVFIGSLITQCYHQNDKEGYRLKSYISLTIRKKLGQYTLRYNSVIQILVVINFFLMYYSITAALSNGSIDSTQPAYSQYQTSVLGIILAVIVFCLFVYASKILRLYTDYFIYIFTLQQLLWEKEQSLQILKNSLEAFGTISLLAFKQIINSPKNLGIKFMYLIKKPAVAHKWENDLSLLTSLSLGRQVFYLTQNQVNNQPIASYQLQESIDALNIQDLEIVYLLYQQAESILKYSGWSIGCMIGLVNSLFGCGFSTIALMIPLCCDLSYVISAQIMKGFLTFGLIEGNQDDDQLMKYYKSIILIEKEELIYKQNKQQQK
ncbi:unnamed protein product (macronuclear) [Paramecium tetraurelia]|uniref:Transmembrane protein n=1 Tax=Paramecium tetraurelia TaxID=5888 RepID=A0BD41_PARTE|nr:uncharacterized protein GSPATT00004552001 [Paramecium tetraurelia]CAK56458.1 unnamed protein product [Paramecium tetraurelia]|eukprot:XP_001423856.1 hypothetical protein (macronuclear) [Paramecium tetraurelia strain d4-2]